MKRCKRFVITVMSVIAVCMATAAENQGKEMQMKANEDVKTSE